MSRAMRSDGVGKSLGLAREVRALSYRRRLRGRWLLAHRPIRRTIDVTVRKAVARSARVVVESGWISGRRR